MKVTVSRGNFFSSRLEPLLLEKLFQQKNSQPTLFSISKDWCVKFNNGNYYVEPRWTGFG